MIRTLLGDGSGGDGGGRACVCERAGAARVPTAYRNKGRKEGEREKKRIEALCYQRLEVLV